MNVYYLFSVKDKYYTELSLILKNKGIFNKFYGMAYAKTRVLNHAIYSHVTYISDILNRQGDIDYAFLKQIETKYAVNIANMIHADRHIMRFDKHKRLFIAQELIKTFINDVSGQSISCVLAEAADDFISYFASYYCKFHDILFLFATYSGYGNKSSFCNTIDSEPIAFKEVFYKILPLVNSGSLDVSFLDKEINKYITEKSKPEYYTLGDANYITFQMKDISTFFNYIVAYMLDKNGMHYEKSPLLLPYYRVAKIINKIIYRKHLRKNTINFKNLTKINYFIYPLHFEPEAATLMQGRWFNDQLKIIELISKNLPVNTILLVKEHKPMIGRRRKGFYSQVTNYHNVYLVDDNTDTYDLISQSRGVIVISSSMGMESLMLKRPVMAFGERFFNVSKNVYIIDNFKNIDEKLTAMINHQFDVLDSLALFYAFFAVTKEMGCLSHFEYKKADLMILANEIKTVIKNRVSNNQPDYTASLH